MTDLHGWSVDPLESDPGPETQILVAYCRSL